MVLFDMSGRRDAAYEWGEAEGKKPDYNVLPTTLPAFPFHGGTSDRPSNTSTQGPVAVRQTSLMPRLETLRQVRSYQRNPAVGTAASANTPLSLRSPNCPVPVCNGNEVFARPAFGLDMKFWVPAMGVQQSMPRKLPTHQRHLPAVVKYTDLDKRKRERRMARREDGRATDAKQARMHGSITVVCVESASPSLTHGEQPGGNVVQANPPFSGIPAAWSGNVNKILRPLPDAKMAPNIPKDRIPADVSASLPETPFIHVVQPNTLGFVVQAQGKCLPGQSAPPRLVTSAEGGWCGKDAHSLHLMWTKPRGDTESPLTYKVTVGKRISDDTLKGSREGYDVIDAVEAYVDTALSYQVRGLCPNSSYRCSVTTISLSGDSTASTSAVFLTAKAPPSQCNLFTCWHTVW